MGSRPQSRGSRMSLTGGSGDGVHALGRCGGGRTSFSGVGTSCLDGGFIDGAPPIIDRSQLSQGTLNTINQPFGRVVRTSLSGASSGHPRTPTPASACRVGGFMVAPSEDMYSPPASPAAAAAAARGGGRMLAALAIGDAALDFGPSGSPSGSRAVSPSPPARGPHSATSSGINSPMGYGAQSPRATRMSLSGIMAACMNSEGGGGPVERSGLSFKDLGIDGATGASAKVPAQASRLGHIVQV